MAAIKTARINRLHGGSIRDGKKSLQRIGGTSGGNLKKIFRGGRDQEKSVPKI